MKTLWAGYRQKDTDRLHALIPAQGEVAPSFDNVHLEMFRRFQNAYYDLYNNGGMNWDIRGKQYHSVASYYGVRRYSKKALLEGISGAYFAPLEELGNKIIDAALAEQFPK